MDGEVVNALLGLLQQGLPEQLPGDGLHHAPRLLQGLVDGHRADLHATRQHRQGVQGAMPQTHVFWL